MESKASFYTELIRDLRALLAGERDLIANAANTSALLAQRLDDVNWVGFYFVRDGELVVGPFQGKPACVRIARGKGVCGTAIVEEASIVVPDVHAFPGHIACDTASRSEVVVPMISEGNVLGVLDIDSPSLNRFDREDGSWLEKLVTQFLEMTDCRLCA